ncbi:MAG: 23S rRNA (guanosine(2251)-2'-O)-methyltransferase RlmB [Anaerolineae bacterium]|nr:23S rRNA (guanosine(2251)-2'-O)-methyltransferase RlmB [Caldilineales bacterium]MDW8270391.1 23S rRNA (guanosine(2251)-2'-O)-methyltransferase RlmB [Anaerolineae bacterium]
MANLSRELIYGRQAVRETLRAGRRRLDVLYQARGMQPNPVLAEIVARAQQAGIPIETVPREQLDARLGAAVNHQGVALAVGPYPYADWTEALARAAQQDQPPFLLLLDRVQDPQNLGALLRTAEACGVHGVILPRHRAAHVTPAVVHASAGASEHLLIGEVTNLVETMRRLQKQGVWLVGLDLRPQAQPLEALDWGGPLGVVVGSEGFGLGRLVAETCDWLLYLPMAGRINSLNAAVAGSIVLYHAMRRRMGQ